MQAMLLDKAAHIDAHPLDFRALSTPSPGPDELVMRVTACGVCRSNLHMVEGDWLLYFFDSYFTLL